MTPLRSGTYSEDAAVEQPAIELLRELGWEHVNAYSEKFGVDGDLGRQSKTEVFLNRSLRSALERLNPTIPADGIEQALTEVTRDRSALHFARANREIHDLLRDRVPVSIRQADGSRVTERLTVIDWEHPENNEFLLVSQFWVKSDLYERRTDLLGFVNGIPLLFIELKASQRNLRHAYDDNLRDYRDTVPHLFTPNGFIVLSNGAETRVGSITSAWEHFLEWKKINSEGEEGRVSLETVIRGMCTRERLLDILEHFIVFQELPGGFVKLVARNHQYLGVNNALARLGEVRATSAAAKDSAPGHQAQDTGGPRPATKLGVFWHTRAQARQCR